MLCTEPEGPAMAFRPDIQGGHQMAGGPGGFQHAFDGNTGHGQLGQALAGNQGVAAIEKTIHWKLAFFVGAACALTAGLVSVVSLIATAQWFSAPASLFAEGCLFIFGIMMLVLDLPFPLPHTSAVAARDQIYKFMLFLTRFTGRAVWYLWLGTMTWVALFDVEGTWFDHVLAMVLTLYLVVLGIASGIKGITLSLKLNKVQDIITHSQRDASAFFARGQVKLSKEQFKMVIEQSANNPVMFTDIEMDYVINALKFTPATPPYEESVTIEEIDYWLKPGWMLLV